MPNGWKWGELRARVHERDQACVRCGSRRLQVHHRVSLGDGGSNGLDNLQLLCAPCHTAIHTSLDTQCGPGGAGVPRKMA